MSKYTLLIKSDNDDVAFMYGKHSTYHEGDSGLDLFLPNDYFVSPGETIFINMGIKCEMVKHAKNGDKYVSYYTYPRSSISKTPLRLANSVGIIDAGYRGNLITALTYVPTKEILLAISNGTSLDKYVLHLKKGDRLMQICTATLEPFNFVL